MATTNTSILAYRPSNPLEISFADHCFEVVGERIEYVVLRSALHSGPAVFGDPDEATAYARRCGRAVSERRTPIRRRVSWR